MAAKLPAVKNADRCLTWEALPSPLQAGKPGNEWEAAGVGQDSLEGKKEGQAGARPRAPSRGQLALLQQRRRGRGRGWFPGYRPAGSDRVTSDECQQESSVGFRKKAV